MNIGHMGSLSMHHYPQNFHTAWGNEGGWRLWWLGGRARW